MESSKMYCPSRCRYLTHQCEAANYPVSWGTVEGPPRKYAKLRVYQYPWYRVCTNAMVILKRKLRAWRVQKCIALVGADIALTSAGPETTPCHGGQYRVHQGNMRNFWPTNTHGTASAPMQWLYQKEATGMESSKMYCPSRCRYRTHQCGAANYPVSWGTVQGPPRKYAKLRAYQYPWYRVSTNAMVILKRKLRAWRIQKCIALVGADIALTSAGPQTTPCHGGQNRVHQGNMRNIGPTNTHGTASAPMQWLY